MAKKYLSLEEAATFVGVPVDEIKRLREQGELRGFADRGAWKFRQEDIEELARRRQADSNPDVPLFDESEEAGSSIIRDEDSLSDQPTMVRSALDEESIGGGRSDSDVRLVLDDSFTKASDPDVDLAGDSDSDVRLVSDSGAAAKKKAVDDHSDSDVKLVGEGSDSDVQLLPDEGTGSDSDVRLVQSSSGVRNTSNSGVKAVPSEGSGIHVDLDEGDDASVLAEESGEFPAGEQSSFALASESGISLESLADSGISLEGTDSGIALQHLADSGISLADDDDDSITLASESGIALKPGRGGRDHQHTTPMLDTSKLDLDRDDTAMEMPTMAEDSEFELAHESSGSSETNVILFDEDDADDQTATVKKTGRSAAAADLDEDFAAADELEVDEEFVSDDDEELDVFDAADADFEDDFEEGESQSDFMPAMAGRMATADAEWSTGTFVGLALATLFMSICGIVMFDLVRYMWHFGEPNTFNSFLLDSIGGMM